jgi:hypothetical protein
MSKGERMSRFFFWSLFGNQGEIASCLGTTALGNKDIGPDLGAAKVAEEAKGAFGRDVDETGVFEELGHVLGVEATFVGDVFQRLAFLVLVDVVDSDHSLVLVLLVGGGGVVVAVGMVVVTMTVTMTVGSIVLGMVVSLRAEFGGSLLVLVTVSVSVSVSVTLVVSTMAMINSTMNMVSLKVQDNHPPTALNNLLSQRVDNRLDILDMMQDIVGKRHIKTAILPSKVFREFGFGEWGGLGDEVMDCMNLVGGFQRGELGEGVELLVQESKHA